MKHLLKTWPGEFAAVRAGVKRFEYRKEDRPTAFRVGDTLLLQEWLPDHDRYTGAELPVRVTWITRPPAFGVPDGYAVLSIEALPRGEAC